jgi:hypothetical protein
MKELRRSAWSSDDLGKWSIDLTLALLFELPYLPDFKDGSFLIGKVNETMPQGLNAGRYETFLAD